MKGNYVGDDGDRIYVQCQHGETTVRSVRELEQLQAMSRLVEMECCQLDPAAIVAVAKESELERRALRCSIALRGKYITSTS